MHTSGTADAALPAVVDHAAEIRAAGLKVTAPRVAVLQGLAASPHATADQLYDSISSTLTGTSLQAVYGVLAAFTTAGLVRRIEPAGSAALFERRVGDNHHHIVCTRCHSVRDVECVTGEAPCLTPSDTAGFVVQTAEVTFWGLCPDCQADTAADIP
ncbi:Fur family transcriptional regulator [Cryobacterium sp.]|jgi:Fe2+ or Zn2+ uptake regulation protein|uniref:Fur family transcriptional regulator n=1 Tax=Cryobacterium sp. TaxID=1926290 RepID=UPI0026341090|nr:Fur family transcriptional regulator [Cryobacterium sp.]MCU1446934.1 transcriptional repressor [Cryobacterium sp.]